MTKRQKQHNQFDKQNHTQKARTYADNIEQVPGQTETDDATPLPETGDAGDAVSEDSLYDASGAATGGGMDTPTAVEESTETEVRKHHHIHQGTSAYTGGGADNGSTL